MSSRGYSVKESVTTCRAGGLRKPPKRGRKMILVLVLSAAVLVIDRKLFVS